jgi:hypothetical protein
VKSAAVGTVVVATPFAAPGLMDVMMASSSGGFYQLDSREVPISPMPEVAGFELDQNWWEPQKVLDTLVHIHETRDDFKTLAMKFAPAVREKLSPESVAKVIEPLLREAVDVLARSGW